uniref:Uncharacterized protein n=1 Tax=Anguilla anguilla TaxID=7936 RepID=A0A0E9QGW4_ANGAN
MCSCVNGCNINAVLPKSLWINAYNV